MYKKLPSEVVQIQSDAESRLYDIRNPIDTHPADIIIDKHDQAEIAELEETLKPVCCSELHLPQLLSVKLKAESMKTLKHVFDDKDLRWNFFYMIGEVTQMPGHCIVLGQTLGKMYAMLHSSNFEVTSPKDM
jgi:hypothetical protein